MPAARWEIAEDYLPLLQYDGAWMMWEWLRRDPLYRALALARGRPTAPSINGLIAPQKQDLNARGNWGLYFCRATRL